MQEFLSTKMVHEAFFTPVIHKVPSQSSAYTTYSVAKLYTLLRVASIQRAQIALLQESARSQSYIRSWVNWAVIDCNVCRIGIRTICVCKHAARSTAA